MVELAAADIAQCQMSHERIRRGPVGGFLRFASQRFAEKREFEAEFVAIGRPQISGVIPPLGLKIGMVEIIAGKFVMVAGDGAAILHHQWIQQQARYQPHEFIPHARPQWD